MKPADPRILTINGGSSSIRFALFEAGGSLRRILKSVISAAASRVAVRVIRPDEERMIGRSGFHALGLGVTHERRNSDQATKYISRLGSFSASGVPP